MKEDMFKKYCFWNLTFGIEICRYRSSEIVVSSDDGIGQPYNFPGVLLLKACLHGGSLMG